MSQFWHAHWAEDGFKPTRLQNWEVPRWHAQWPVRHCTTTEFQAHKNGRLYADFKKPSNPWSKFKGTWELPLKIDRRTAEQLSRSTEYKKAFWNFHKAKHECICKNRTSACTEFKGNKKKQKNQKDKEKKSQNENNTETKHSNTLDGARDMCKLKKACVL